MPLRSIYIQAIYTIIITIYILFWHANICILNFSAYTYICTTCTDFFTCDNLRDHLPVHVNISGKWFGNRTPIALSC